MIKNINIDDCKFTVEIVYYKNLLMNGIHVSGVPGPPDPSSRVLMAVSIVSVKFWQVPSCQPVF